jgi:urea transporter
VFKKTSGLLPGNSLNSKDSRNGQSNPLLSFVATILNSYSIIFFANNRWLGLLLLLATFSAPSIGICGLVGVVIAVLTARILKFTTAEDTSGYYSFNSLLVSLGIAYFYPADASNYIFLLTILFFASIITTFLSVALSKYFQTHLALPSLSFAFVIITLIICFIYIRLTHHPLLIAPLPTFISWTPPIKGWVELYLKSIGSILFQANLVGGILVALVILISSRISFLLSIIGFWIGYTFITATGTFTESEIMLTGFNTMLTAIAIGGVFFIPSISSFIIAVIASVAGILIAISIQGALRIYNIPPLAIPFNLTVLAILYAFKFRLKNTNPYLVDFYSGSPEQNLEYYYARIVRFAGSGHMQFFLPFNGEWAVTQGPDDEITHKHQWREAWDFEVVDENGAKFTNHGNELKDYYCFNKPIIVPANGTVVKVINWINDNQIGEINARDNWGNLVVIYHAPGVYSLLSHLKHNSIQVTEGQTVKAGDLLAACGNSGRSAIPHLHFHIQTTAEPGSPTVKVNLINYLLKNSTPHTYIKFGSPQKDDRLVALKPDLRLQELLNFKLQDRLDFQVTVESGKTFPEHWKIGIDFWGNLYIDSSRKARAWFSIYNGILNIIKFEGNTKSAIYAFTLALPSFTYTDDHNLVWHDQPPINTVLPITTRTVQDILSFIARPLNFIGRYETKADLDGNVNIIGKINLTLAKMVISNWTTNCYFHLDKGITRIELNFRGKLKIKAELIS